MLCQIAIVAAFLGTVAQVAAQTCANGVLTSYTDYQAIAVPYNYIPPVNYSLPVGAYSSDEGSMPSLTAAPGLLTISPNITSYFYDVFPCEALTNTTVLTFNVTGPVNSSFLMQAITREDCVTDPSPFIKSNLSITLNTTAQSVYVPLGNFPGAQLNALTAIAFLQFRVNGTSPVGGNFTFTPLQFICSATTT